MKMNKIYIIFSVMFIFFIITSEVYGFGNGFNANVIPDELAVTEIRTPVNKVWGTVSLILRICAVAGIIFTGIRYMFATANAKADMKQTLPYLIIGIVIIFAGSYVIDFIVKVFAETTGT